MWGMERIEIMPNVYEKTKELAKKLIGKGLQSNIKSAPVSVFTAATLKKKRKQQLEDIDKQLEP